MAQKSYLWTTGGAGDGAAEYSRLDWARVMRIVAGMSEAEGIVDNIEDELSVSVSGLNSVVVQPGAALVDGKPYWNDTEVTVNIPSAVGAGNTRFDRIVLRADWTAQTVRIFRIAGTDAASPSVPSLTQSSGVTYDFPIAITRVNTTGTITSLTDQRQLARMGDIVNDQLTLATIKGDKLGGGTVRITNRKGYSAGGWTQNDLPNEASFQLFDTPTKVEVGMIKVPMAAGATTAAIDVYFQQGFSASPLVFVTPAIIGSALQTPIVGVQLNTFGVTSYFELHVRRPPDDGGTNATTYYIQWLAIGVF